MKIPLKFGFNLPLISVFAWMGVECRPVQEGSLFPQMDPVDPSLRPGDSFYFYANNEWLNKTSIPPEKSRWSMFNVLDELSKSNLKELLESLSGEPVGSSIIAEFYASGLDTAQIEAKGLEPIRDLLDGIDAVKSLDDVWRIVGAIRKDRLAYPFFAFGSSPDAKNSSWEIAQVYQAGLGLPDRDYYELESKREIREKYRVHIANMFVLAGIDKEQAQTHAHWVLDLETKIAAASLKMAERRDSDKTYNKRTLQETKALSTNIGWDVFLKEVDLSGFDELNLESPAFLIAVSKLAIETPLDHLKAYLRFHLLSGTAEYLPQRFVDEDFDFFKRTLSGILENEPLWKRVTSKTSNALRDAVANMYVEKHFPASAKESASEMINYIIQAFKERIQAAEWMEQATKKKALEKLAKFNVKIGYPDKWLDLSPLNGQIKRSQAYLHNIRLASRYVFKVETLQAINKPVDRSKWEMPPFLVNACSCSN